MVFASICELMLPVLDGPARSDIVGAAARAPRMPEALAALAQGLSSHAFHTSQGPVRFAKLIDRYDGLTRADGFHVLHEWDGASDEVNADAIPLDVLNYIADLRRNDATDHRVLAILLDYYFLHVLSLLALRIWDDGDANRNLDRVGVLLAALQGPQGSGHRFVSDPETLILLATSHYERDPSGYDRLLDRTRTLSVEHQLRIAAGHAACLGGHLRFGFEAAYGHDAALMRHDNAVDYPWLRQSLATLLDALNTSTAPLDRATVVEALLGGVSADPALLTADPDLAPRFARHRHELVAAFEAYRPSDVRYSPLACFFNFSHSVVRGAVIDAALWGEPWPVTLNDLLSSRDAEPTSAPLDRRLALATTLMDYARKNPHRLRGKLTPAIVYDPATGRRVFAAVASALI